MDETLEESVRRVDPDRWLSSRFVADPLARADLVTLYAFDHELSRAGQVASNPLIGEIRLTWWREVVEQIVSGGTVRAHPVAHSLRDVVRRHKLPPEPLQAMIDARIDTLEIERFSPDQARAWAWDAPGAAAALAARTLAPSAPEMVARRAGAAWGLASLVGDGAASGADLAEDIRTGLAEANAARGRFPIAAFPAIAHATLARGPGASPLEKRARILVATLLGRV